MGKINVQEADAIIDKAFPVLDHGFVRLVDYMGGDDRVVSAARVSYGAGTKSIREDRGLINYLISHEHMSPFEQVVLTFHIKLPIFVARQWIRHRTARVNELSGRYSVMSDDFYVPVQEQVREQSTHNKQGRSDKELSEKDKKEIISAIRRNQESAYSGYQEILNKNVARELARINLPLSIYTQWYWQMDLRNLFNFLRLRLDMHAQYEIRCYAQIMANITKLVAPLSYDAFEEHVLYSLHLSKSEAADLKLCLLKLKIDTIDGQSNVNNIIDKINNISEK
jgi:thymidylate synthase (FAD)